MEHVQGPPENPKQLAIRIAKDVLSEFGLISEFVMAKHADAVPILFLTPFGWNNNAGLMVEVGGPEWCFGFPLGYENYFVNIANPNFKSQIQSLIQQCSEQLKGGKVPSFEVTHKMALDTPEAEKKAGNTSGGQK